MGNPPHDDEYIELHVRNMANGAFTESVFNKMKEKDILRFEGPLGTFFMREDSDKPMVLVASGTGFAPIKSIIEHAFHMGSTRQMVLYWGGRRPADLYMAELAGRWQQEHDNFSFIPVVSDALAEDNWHGRTGFVHKAVMEDLPDLSRISGVCLWRTRGGRVRTQGFHDPVPVAGGRVLLRRLHALCRSQTC